MLNEELVPNHSEKSRFAGRHNELRLFQAVLALLLSTAVASYAQGSMGGNMGNMQHMQNMNNMQQMQSMSQMMEHMQTMTHELSGMQEQMKGGNMGNMSGMKNMDHTMSTMDQMSALGRNMEALIDQMSKSMADKGMMSDPKMKDQMMQMQMHMGSLVDDYHGMMENLKRGQKSEGK